MTTERFLERKLELKQQAIELLTAERDGFRNSQEQLQVINNGLMDSIAKYAAERLVLRELVDGATGIVEILPVTFPAQIAWKKNWLEKAREVLK